MSTGHLTTNAEAAVAYARSHDMTSGIAVMDTKTGALSTAGAAQQLFASASVAKILIAARLLAEHRMTEETGRLAFKMISQSDNAAAWTLYPRVGGDELMDWTEAHFGLTDVGARPSMPGIWGSTQISAAGLAKLYAKLRTDKSVWPWLVKAMHAYAARSSAGEPNAFGIAAASPEAAVKNGWDTNRDVEHPTNAIINTTGFVDHDRYAVVILAEGPNYLYYSQGEQVLTAAAKLLLPGGEIAAVGNSAPLVVLDPGHDGGNASHPQEISRLVPAGYGTTKPCNTTGTTTDAGYAEHAFTWDVADRVRALLQAHGIRVRMTRTGDNAVGPCVDRRAALESGSGVAAAVAIHADGAPADGSGFHVCLASRQPEGASASTIRRSHALGRLLHADLVASSGLTPSDYVGSNGYLYRDDLAGLNLSTSPTAFLELGNMRNPEDARKQASAAGRQRIAEAVAQGIEDFLGVE
jgi:N-acetylmuramoyl-L-alanine amidase